MKSIKFSKQIFRFLGIQMDARDFYTFSERWLFSTNHKYIGILYLLFSIVAGFLVMVLLKIMLIEVGHLLCFFWILSKKNVFVIIKRIVTLVLSFLFYIRSFFLVERINIIPSIIFGIVYYSVIKQLPIIKTFLCQISILVILGLLLLGLESICVFVSIKVVKDSKGIFDDVGPFLSRSVKENTLLNDYKAAGLKAILTEKTALTITAGASFLGALVGVFFLILAFFLKLS